MYNEYTIKEISLEHWPTGISLIARTLNNSLLGWFGKSFISIFYMSLSDLEHCCAYAAYDKSGEMAGVIIGSLDYRKAYSEVLKKKRIKLFLAANFRILRWSVIKWFLNGLRGQSVSETRTGENNVLGRLIVISVAPKFQGEGVAQKLVHKMESWFAENGLVGPYIIYTEQSNHQANRFYEKIGASAGLVDFHHGRAINKWYKTL